MNYERKNILIIEDSGDMYFRMVDELSGLELNIFQAYQVSDAIDIVQNENIDFIISDLLVPPIGLNENELNMPFCNKIAGWYFLVNYAFRNNDEMRKKTIIYSSFTDILIKQINPIDLNKIQIFDKHKDSINKVINYLKTNLLA